jgi:hypothetical protein
VGNLKSINFEFGALTPCYLGNLKLIKFKTGRIDATVSRKFKVGKILN